MDLTVFYTNGGQTPEQTGKTSDKTGDGDFTRDGIFGMLLEGMLNSQPDTSKQTGDKSVSTSDNPALAQNPYLDSAQNQAILNGTFEGVQDALATPLGVELAPMLLNQNVIAPEAFKNMPGQIEGALQTEFATPEGLLELGDINTLSGQANLAGISDILILNGKDLGTDPGLLARITEQIQQLQQDNKTNGILFNLTPEQMTTLQNDILAAQDAGNTPDAGAGFNFVLFNLAQPKNTAANASANTPADIALIGTLPFANGTNGQANQTQKPQVNYLSDLLESVEARNFDELLNIKSPTDKFSALLKNAAALKGDSAQNAAQLAAQADTANVGHNPNAAQTSPLNNLNGLLYPDGSLLSSLGFDEAQLQAMGIQTSTFQVSGVQALTSLPSQAAQAGQPHPGTALVAMTMTKATAANGGTDGNRAITLQLDPPELGRVEIRMQFGHDKQVKAVIMSEKPEAHMMLQRDADALQRALQDAGLEADSGSLEFTLADDGQNFGQDGSHDGSRNKAGFGGTEDAEDMELIETTMTWHVDPETGHMRYNLIV